MGDLIRRYRVWCSPVRNAAPAPVGHPVRYTALSVAFYPDALAQLIGKPIEPFIDTILPAAEVLEAALLASSEAIFEQAAAPALFGEIEARLHPFWAGVHGRSPAPLVGEWLRTLVTRAAFSKTGCGARQLQRRIKSWAGQSYRDLQIYARVETAFVQSGAPGCAAASNLAELALSAGLPINRTWAAKCGASRASRRGASGSSSRLRKHSGSTG